MVLVSRSAVSLYLIHSVAFTSGPLGSPVGLKSSSSGWRRGSSDSGMVVCLPFSQMMGNGSPQ